MASTRGKKSKNSFDRRTPFKDKIGGRRRHGTSSDLLRRTKCFKCGKLGHMARECRSGAAQNPNERATSERSRAAFFANAPAMKQLFAGFATMASETPEEVRIYVLQRFVGLVTSLGCALMDPGAQEGCVGLTVYKMPNIYLEKHHKLIPVEYPVRSNINCGGVGGGAKVLFEALVPVGVAGINGIMALHVLEDHPGAEVPLLFPVNLINGLQCVMDFGTGELTLKAFKATTKMTQMKTQHWEVNITEYAPGGWRLPDAARQDYDESKFRITEKDNTDFPQKRRLIIKDDKTDREVAMRRHVNIETHPPQPAAAPRVNHLNDERDYKTRPRTAG